MTLVDFMGHAAFSDKLPMELSDGRYFTTRGRH